MDSYFSEEKKNLPYYYYIHTYKLLSNYYYCALLYYPQCVEIKTKGSFFFFASMFLRRKLQSNLIFKGRPLSVSQKDGIVLGKNTARPGFHPANIQSANDS